MSEWLLIIVLTTGLWGEGMPVTTVTMHDFPTRELCVSAGNRVEKLTSADERVFSYRCLKKSGNEWIGKN